MCHMCGTSEAHFTAAQPFEMSHLKTLACFKDAMLIIVRAETEARKPKTAERDTWLAVGKLLEQRSVRELPAAMFFLCKRYKIMTASAAFRYADMFANMIKQSCWKEKFARYAHNLNEDKAMLYHNKLAEFDRETIDKMQDNPECVFIRLADKVLPQNDGGYMEYCAHAQEMHQLREDIAASMRKLIKAEAEAETRTAAANLCIIITRSSSSSRA